jgi:hypothetical protein
MKNNFGTRRAFLAASLAVVTAPAARAEPVHLIWFM